MRQAEETPTMFNGPSCRAAWVALGIAWLAIAGPGLASAQNAIRSVTSSQEGGTDVVRVELAQPLAAVPTGFSVQSPPRIAIDLPGVGNGLGHHHVELNQGNLRSVSLAEVRDRTRLVLNLKRASAYRAQLQGQTLLLLLDTGARAADTVAVAPPEPMAGGASFALPQNTESLPLRAIDFRRGTDGAGRLIVGLPGTQLGVDIRQQGRNLVVEFLRASLPETLRRRLDVTDFGTPVRTVTAFQSGDRVRMVIEPGGAWEHSAYQSDDQFVLEVRPIKVDPNKLTPGPGFSGEKLSLNFQSIEVRALLQVIADFTNFNVVTSDTVTGAVTLRLKDVPWDQALDIILQSKGLGVRKNGNVLWIAPKEELSAKEQIELESRKKLAELEPTRTQSFQLNYTRAEDVAKGIAGQTLVTSGSSAASNPSGRMLSPRGSVLFESRTNQLFVTDVPGKLQEIQELIAKIDVPVRQVLIEARIVEADDSFGRNLGVKLGSTDARGAPARAGVSIGGNYDAIGVQTGQLPGPVDFQPNSQFVNLPAGGISGARAATFALSLFGASANRFLNLELSALEAEGRGNIVSSPRVITADQREALIEQGEDIPYQQATSSGATSVSFKKATLSLKVKPQITPEGNVILTVEVNKDSRGELTTAGPAINTKRVTTEVLVENGGTVVIGGIFTQDEQNRVSKVPLLGDIPFVGALFRSSERSTRKTELLVFITPKIVTELSAAR
jgi:type IV pilus assembly protein PilQ